MHDGVRKCHIPSCISRERESIKRANYALFFCGTIVNSLLVPSICLPPGYKIVKCASSNTVFTAYINSYKFPPLYPTSNSLWIDPVDMISFSHDLFVTNEIAAGQSKILA